MKVLRTISRILVGLVFIYSGFVKGIDPLGLTYKLGEYFEVYHVTWLDNISLSLAIVLCMIEFTIGVALVFGAKMKVTSWAVLIMMSFFTIQTFLAAIFNQVSDCGCFGDAIHLTNWETFYKNVVLIVFAIIIFTQRNKYQPFFSDKTQWGTIGAGAIFLISLSIYCYRHLPIIDFRPWKVGTKISEKVIAQPEVSEIMLVYKNKKTGEQKEYSTKDLPWQDTTWVANWEFVKQNKKIIKEFKEAPIHDFQIVDQDGKDHTSEVVNNPNYQFMIVAYDINKTNKEAFKKINELQKQIDKAGYSFVAVCGSSFENIDAFRHETQSAFPFYQADATALKTIVRSNPGLTLLKGGVVLAHWHYNDLPDMDKLKKEYLK
ncbi:MAG: DoxX family protein [Bacteroidota bacterium]|nr:DoxX family protein [Bacteroidota bacterium]